MSLAYYTWLGGAMVVFITASTLLRRYIDVSALPLLICALALYTLGNLIMVRLMRESGMAVAVSVSAVVQLVAANLVAILAFGERPPLAQTIGIGLGMVAVALILIPWKGQGG